MRILYLTAESFDEPIIQSQVVNLMDHVAGHPDITSITLFTVDDPPLAGREPQPAPRHVVHVGTPNRGILRGILASIRYVWQHRRGYDIVHVRSYLPMFAGIVARVFLGKRLVFDPRGLFAEEQSYASRRPLTSFLFKRLETLFCALSDSIVVVSEPFAEHFNERYRLPPGRVKVIPTFSSEYEGEASSETVDVRERMGWQDAVIFVYSGSTGPWQMIEEVVTFFGRVGRRMPEARFLFLCHPTERLLSLLREGLPEHAYALLRVPSKELSACLSQCDYGVLLRAEHIVNRVSAPIKVKDYLVAGLPIIISDHVGDSSDFVRRHGSGLVLPDLSESAADEVIGAIEARPTWDRARIAAVSRANFDIVTVANQYHELYRSLGPTG